VVLHAVEAGPADGSLVVLLHGFPEFWYSWRHQIPALARAGVRVLAPDLRGYGQSDKPRGPEHYTGTALAGDVAGLVRAAGAQRATIVGHDWGGLAAWLTAMRTPEVVDRLVILNAPHPAVFGAAMRDPLQMVRSSYMGFFQLPVVPEAVLGAAGGFVLKQVLRRTARRPDAFTDADLDRYGAAFAEPGALTCALDYYRAMGRSQAASRGAPRTPRAVSAPTTVIWGTEDPILPLRLADPGRQRVPDCRVIPVEGAGHFVQSDAPEQVSRLILDAAR